MPDIQETYILHSNASTFHLSSIAVDSEQIL